MFPQPSLRILEAGLDNLSLSLVPPSLTGLLLEILKGQGREKFAVLYSGANDGVLPARLQEDGIFPMKNAGT